MSKTSDKTRVLSDAIGQASLEAVGKQHDIGQILSNIGQISRCIGQKASCIGRIVRVLDTDKMILDEY